MSTRTNITREDHPNFWSFFVLVQTTMGIPAFSLTSLAASPEEVARLDAQLGTWSLRDVCALAGVVQDDAGLADGTDIGVLVSEWLGLD